MALSDSCSDVLNDLAKELVWYSDWGYQPEQLIPVIDALYNLASFTVGQDVPPGMLKHDPELGISRIVIGAILGVELKDDEIGRACSAEILQLLPEISRVHSRLSKSIDDVHAEVSKNAESFMIKMNPEILNQLTEIMKNKA